MGDRSQPALLRVTKWIPGPSPSHKTPGLNTKILGVAYVLKSAEEKGFIKREDQLRLGIVPQAPGASQGASVFPCLWLCLHEALPALLLDQKTGVGKGAQWTGRNKEEERSRFFWRLLMEAVLQLGPWVGRVSWDPTLIPVLAAALLSQARGWEEFTVPYFCQPAACPFSICALCWAALSILLMGLGFSSQTNWKTALVAKEGPAASAPEVRRLPPSHPSEPVCEPVMCWP